MTKKEKIISPTDKENDEINQGIAKDKDNPEWMEEDFKRARPAREVLQKIFGKESANQLLKRNHD